MSMQTVRRKALRQNPYSTLGKPPLVKLVSRELPDNVRELLIERAALRAEITTLTVKAQGLKKSDVSVHIADRLRRIDAITSLLENRKCNA